MRFHHVGVEVNHLERSISFYQEVLGFQLSERIRLAGEEIAFLTRGNSRLELIKAENRSPISTNLHTAFEVEELLSWANRLRELNVRIVEGPLLLENGWKNLFFYGPDRELIELVELGAIRSGQP
jgi:lactoylglutathione lyase